MVRRAILVASVVLACTVTVANATTRREQQEEACYADAMRLCSQYVPNESQITACMQAHVSQLSAPCAAMFTDGNGR